MKSYYWEVLAEVLIVLVMVAAVGCFISLVTVMIGTTIGWIL